MSDAVKVGFVPFSTARARHSGGVLRRRAEIRRCDPQGARRRPPNLVKRAAATNQFKGKSGSTLDILAPEGLKASRLIVVGAGKLSASRIRTFSSSAARRPANSAPATRP